MATAAPSDDWLATAERAVRAVAEGRMAGDSAVAAIAAAVAKAMLERTPAERMAQEADMFLAKFDEYGGDRSAAGKVGRFFGRDPLEQERIAQRVRKLAAARKANRPARPRGRPPKKN